jgi:uncharacterized protein (TIGR02284 family)
MESLEAKTPIVNDLIQINHDRVAGYEKAISILTEEDTDLKTVFQDFIGQSNRFINELEEEIQHKGAIPMMNSSFEGKIYRTWMDIKVLFTDNDRKAILKSCLKGEDAAYITYALAEKTEELPSDTRFVIARQKQQLRMANNKIKTLNDLEI